jgi:hypothetical protein
MKKHTEEERSAATTVAAAPTIPPPVGGADALPSIGAPTPPIRDNPVTVSTRKGMRAIAAEVNLAENAARELRASALFSQVLGPRLGTAQQIADAIDFAAQWGAQNKAGATWSRYTQGQSNLAWNYALAMVDRLRDAFQAAVAMDPAIEKELPNFTKLLAVRQDVAAKGVVTKKRIKSGELVVKKRAKPPAKATTSPPKATDAGAAQASTPAPAGATPANGANGATH